MIIFLLVLITFILGAILCGMYIYIIVPKRQEDLIKQHEEMRQRWLKELEQDRIKADKFNSK